MKEHSHKDLTVDQIWEYLEEVKDPEIPVISVVELGIIREVSIEGPSVRVTMTPTFSGCPALRVMQQEIATRLKAEGVSEVEVVFSNDPPWSSDWITPEGRRKLKEFGLAPPPRHGGNLELMFPDIVSCPYCGSENTVLRNSFGSTLCRAIYTCNDCRQPFEQFKGL